VHDPEDVDRYADAGTYIDRTKLDQFLLQQQRPDAVPEWFEQTRMLWNQIDAVHKILIKLLGEEMDYRFFERKRAVERNWKRCNRTYTKYQLARMMAGNPDLSRDEREEHKRQWQEHAGVIAVCAYMASNAWNAYQLLALGN
jgi:hypothetical protein